MKQPCDEALIQARAPTAPGAETSRPQVLAVTIRGTSMAFIDGTVVNVALPVLQSELHATVVDVQWVIESYGLFLSALILVDGALAESVAVGPGFGSVWLLLRWIRFGHQTNKRAPAAPS